MGPHPYQHLREGLVGLQGLMGPDLSESVLGGGGGGKATKLKCATINYETEGSMKPEV